MYGVLLYVKFLFSHTNEIPRRSPVEHHEKPPGSTHIEASVNNVGQRGSKYRGCGTSAG